jgi:hypothetical protein
MLDGGSDNMSVRFVAHNHHHRSKLLHHLFGFLQGGRNSCLVEQPRVSTCLSPQVRHSSQAKFFFFGGGGLSSVAFPYLFLVRIFLVTRVCRSCIMKYLDKIHKRVERTPCPCCRRSFTDLQVEERQKKVSLFGRHAPRLSRFLRRGN